VVGWWTAAPAVAADETPVVSAADDPGPLRFSGLGMPLVGANSIDGLGFGAAGEVYGRPAEMAYGYRIKFTAQLWTTTRFDYTNNYLQVDSRGQVNWTGRAGYRAWENLSYAGNGGADVAVLHGDALERGNAVGGPVGLVGLAVPVRASVELYGQVYGRQVRATAGPGTLLAADRAFGLGDGVFGELTVGTRIDTTDRWPMPARGQRIELCVSGGNTWLDGWTPTAAAMVNAIDWTPVWGDRVVVGGRLLALATTGTRPFWEREMTAGVWRNELGMETSFTGYGRARSRGDAAVAGLVELRPKLWTHDAPFWDVSLHASLFAEQGWLFDGWDPGPPLPTVGGGPLLFWQKAIQMRPFVAVGWTAEGPGQARRPSLQYSVSFVDPL